MSSVERIAPWLRRALGLLLAVGSLYLLAIDQLSPHHLPGLRWLAFLVFAAGAMSVFIGTRFRRIELAACLAAVIFGGLAVGDVTMAASVAPKKAHASTAPQGADASTVTASR